MKRHVFQQLYYHFVSSVKDRQPSISAALKPDLLRFIEDKSRELEGKVVAVNCVEDHVHLLVELLPKHAPADFIGKVKGSSSYHVNHHLTGHRRLEWQEGYGVVTLRKGEMKKAITYVADQERLHQERKASAVFETFEVLVG